ncbi:sorbosone dehydrogenase family protein [Rossellomorea vietnamensis]|uniref:Sorbosone dehydrogenase family protein n=1 Tax=Rossellomorea vietnamensis TaxID=218284 RepID=A0A5D4M9U0_9BACI|nr:sorbosone dehydrogenase family protein [Rossellomorea vietnamensis]TYR98669.1 sorbosone dehydrogenase family protein [Rossellomorea vietnamensis]
MKKQMKLAGTFCFLLLASCSNTPSESPEAPETQETTATKNVDVEVLAENLEVPWSINKAGNVIYINERTGGVIKLEDGDATRMEVSLKEPLAEVSEAGFLGFVLHPDFPDNPSAFGYYTYQNSSSPHNRVVVLNLEGEVWEEGQTLLDDIPSGQYHHGGRLEIGPDNKLYITTGDATEEDIAQDENSLGGKILRMNLDGSVPEDNPFEDSYMFSYGHRNPQGMAWSESGELYSTEHGPSAMDEINLIKAGANYGWPVITGDEEQEGMQPPVIHSGSDTWAPSGAAINENQLYFAALRGEGVKRLSLDSGEVEDVLSGFGRVRDVYIEGDTLYFVSNNTDGRGNPAEGDDKLYSVPLSQLNSDAEEE